MNHIIDSFGSKKTKKIIYYGFYSSVNEPYKRNSSLAAVNKMNYLIQVLTDLNFNITVLSPSWIVENNTNKIIWSRSIKRSPSITIKFAPSFYLKQKLMKKATNKLKILISFLWSFVKLISDENQGIVTVYHSPLLFLPIYFSKKVRNYKLILEVEEIYYEVWRQRKIFKKMEEKLLKIADAYIFSTHTLAKRIKYKKPYIVSYGEFNYNEQRVEKFNDGKIHLVYAGTFDPLIGVIEGIKAAKFLDDKYHLHIIGFGNEKETNEVLTLIENIKKETKCIITYDGCLKGDDYINFIQKCHIGLSTIPKTHKFVDYIFPSKILSYLCNNLIVVSSDLESVKTSPFADLIYFYAKNDPLLIAETIKKIKVLDNVALQKEKINNLNKNFKKELFNLINELE